MAELEFIFKDYSEIENAKILKLKGVIDTNTVGKLEEKFADILDSKFTKIILDCSELKFISSSGLGSIMAFSEDLEDIDETGFLKILFLSEPLKDIFITMGFADLLEIYDTEEELLNSI
jgi:anti-anti-sigma factor